jgi:hypothetical protein
MKSLITVISSLLVGLSLATANFSPLHELQHFLGNKRRILYAAILAAAGFVFMMAAILLGTVEAVLQYDAQGFILWSPLFMVTAWFACAGIFVLAAARLTLPVRTITPAAHMFPFAELNKEFGISELIERWLNRMAEGAPQEPGPPPENKFNDVSAGRSAEMTKNERELYSH